MTVVFIAQGWLNSVLRERWVNQSLVAGTAVQASAPNNPHG